MIGKKKSKTIKREVWRAEYPYGNRLMLATSFEEALEIAKLDTGHEPDKLGRAHLDIIAMQDNGVNGEKDVDWMDAYLKCRDAETPLRNATIEEAAQLVDDWAQTAKIDGRDSAAEEMAHLAHYIRELKQNFMSPTEEVR
jgi:hypothetical protein